MAKPWWTYEFAGVPCAWKRKSTWASLPVSASHTRPLSVTGASLATRSGDASKVIFTAAGAGEEEGDGDGDELGEGEGEGEELGDGGEEVAASGISRISAAGVAAPGGRAGPAS